MPRTYEAVFIYIKINLPTFVFLRTKLYTNNVNFVQNNDHTLQNSVNFVQITSTTLYEKHQLCTNNVNFVRTTSSLYEQRQLCKDNDNFVRTMFTLRTNGVNFVRTTSSLYEQRQICTNRVEETRNYRLTCTAFGYCRLFQYSGLYRSQNCSRIASDKTMLIIKISTSLFPWHVKDNVCRVKTRVKQ